MYQWLVFLHVLSSMAFMLGHGTSIAMAFAIRKERDRQRIATMLDLSGSSIGLMFIGLLVLLVTGVINGFMGQWWKFGWIWTSLGLLIVITVLMGIRGSNYYTELRKAVGTASREGPAGEPASQEEIEKVLASAPGRAIEMAVMGFGGIAIIVWLMMFKPF
jgi:uncharacterized membrane protein